MSKIGIIGSGSFGIALAHVLNKKNKVKIWSFTKEEMDSINNDHKCLFIDDYIIDSSITCSMDYEKVISDSDYILLVSPSINTRDICRDIKKYINNQKIILASKGLDNGELLSKVVEEELNISPSIISGPSYADQIVRNMPTYINYYGGKDIKDLFETKEFHMYELDDKIGIEITGALKNVVTIIVGICEGLGYESNTISYVLTEGLKEIKNIGVSMGAKEETFYDLCGMGDLIVTSSGLNSRNKRFGILLSQGKNIEDIKDEIGMTIEGLNTLNSAYTIINKHNLDCKLISNLYDIIYNNKDVKTIID